MSGPAEQVHVRPGTRLGRWLLRQPLRHLGAGLVLVLLAVSGLFGGLEKAPVAQARGLEPLVEGSVVETGPYRILVDSVRTLDEVPGLTKAEADDRWVAVVVELRGLGEESTSEPLILASVRAPGLGGVVQAGEPDPADPDGSRPDTAIVVEDTSRLALVPPGGPVFRVALLWPQGGDVPVPTSLDVQLVGHTYRPSAVDGQLIWTDPAPLAEGTLPVTPAQPAPA